MAPLADLRPAALNDVVYDPIAPDDPGIGALARGMRATIDRFGVKAIDPLVVTRDGVIVSGHRRRAAFLRLGVKRVPVRVLDVRSTDPDFRRLLVRYNDQRDKDPGQRVREQLALADPDAAYRNLVTHRAEKARVKAAPLALGTRRKRHAISGNLRPFLAAAQKVLDELEDYWPVTDRTIHYHLLNDPPLTHARKPGSGYRNDKNSFKKLTNLLTRARIAGLVPFEAIGDETRPVGTWAVYPNVGPFVADQVRGFLSGYARDLTAGQPNHVEIVGEKMTIQGIISPVASRFCVPYTIGRGYSSLPPRKDMYDRFVASGKAKLVILFLSDHDPEGADIPGSFALSMRDDFGVTDVQAVKVGLRHDQVAALNLPENTEAKAGSSRYKKFAEKYGRYAYELEAVPPDLLRRWLTEAVEAVIDVEAFNRQVELERQDAGTLSAYQEAAAEYLSRVTRP